MKNLTVSKADLISKLKTIEGLTNEERANLIGLLCPFCEISPHHIRHFRQVGVGEW